MTSPIFLESAPHEEPREHESSPGAQRDLSSRLSHLEEEVGELRDTISRFAELVLGEVKELRHSNSPSPLPIAAPREETHSLGESAAASSASQVPVNDSSAARPWLLVELLHDLGGTFHMCFDPRYRVRRATRIMVPLILLLFGSNYFFFHHVLELPVLSTVLEKIIDFVLAILLYKVVSRETARYRQAIQELTAWQRYQSHVGAVVVGGDPPTTRLDTE